MSLFAGVSPRIGFWISECGMADGGFGRIDTGKKDIRVIIDHDHGLLSATLPAVKPLRRFRQLHGSSAAALVSTADAAAGSAASASYIEPMDTATDGDSDCAASTATSGIKL